MGLFDVHAHLTDPRLAAQESDVLARAKERGVTTIISNGLNPDDNEAVAALARRSELVQPAFGLYPVDAVLPAMLAAGVDYPRDGEPCDPEAGVAWVAEHVSDCVAVGEIGLDRYWVPEPHWEAQEAVFRKLVAIALDADKPIIIHTRKAERRAFEVLQEMGAMRVDWHCFGGKLKLARRILEHGHYLSIPANARKSESFTRLLQTAPRDRLLLETDCPYLGPTRGELNEPANVRVTAEYAAELWDTDVRSVQSQVESNFERLFGFAP